MICSSVNRFRFMVSLPSSFYLKTHSRGGPIYGGKVKHGHRVFREDRAIVLAATEASPGDRNSDRLATCKYETRSVPGPLIRRPQRLTQLFCSPTLFGMPDERQIGCCLHP